MLKSLRLHIKKKTFNIQNALYSYDVFIIINFQGTYGLVMSVTNTNGEQRRAMKIVKPLKRLLQVFQISIKHFFLFILLAQQLNN